MESPTYNKRQESCGPQLAVELSLQWRGAGMKSRRKAKVHSNSRKAQWVHSVGEASSQKPQRPRPPVHSSGGRSRRRPAAAATAPAPSSPRPRHEVRVRKKDRRKTWFPEHQPGSSLPRPECSWNWRDTSATRWIAANSQAALRVCKEAQERRAAPCSRRRMHALAAQSAAAFISRRKLAS